MKHPYYQHCPGCSYFFDSGTSAGYIVLDVKISPGTQEGGISYILEDLGYEASRSPSVRLGILGKMLEKLTLTFARVRMPHSIKKYTADCSLSKKECFI
jgi:hypothetical protein